MKQITTLTACLIVMFGAAAYADDARVVTTIVNRKLPHLDMRFRQLMLDEYVVAARTDNVRKVYHQAEKIGRPLLTCEKPFELEKMSLNVPSVLYDKQAGKYRMYYHNVWKATKEQGGHMYIAPCYAESDDGLNWTKPVLNQVAYRDHGDDNNVMAGIRDPLFSAAIDHEGKIRIWWCPNNGTTTLEDGIRLGDRDWADLGRLAGMAERRPIDGGLVSDQWRVMYDPVRREYRATAKTWAPLAGSKVPGKSRRAVTVLTSRDGINWHHTGRIIQTDLAYDAYAEQLPNRAHPQIPAWSELHDKNMQRYEQLIVSVDCILFFVDEDGAEGREITGKNTKHFLTWSRDGVNFSRPIEREPFIPVAWGTPDWGRHTMGSPFMIVREKEIWVYCDIGHGHENCCYTTPNPKTITMAKLRRDGFASMKADGEGWVETAPFVAGGELKLNVDASAGSARVAVYAVVEDREHVGKRALKPIEGFTFADAEPLTGDLHAAAPMWKNAGWSDLEGERVALRVRLSDAELYSFWTRTGAGEDAVVNLVDP